MELAHHVPPSVADQYRARFGEAGAFETAHFPETVTMALMAEALRRDAPVTREDLEATHQMLYHLPMPEAQPVWPSGYQPPTPAAAPQWPPDFYTAVPPAPVPEVAPAPPEASEEA